MSRRQTRFGGTPRPKKKVPPGPKSQNLECLRFRFDRLDLDGPWCFSKIDPDHLKQLLPKLAEYESMNVGEAFSGRPGKDYFFSRSKPPRHLVDRLEEIEADDLDGISRLQITGRQRLYGIRNRNEFSILWWDPEHQIWPSRKRNT